MNRHPIGDLCSPVLSWNPALDAPDGTINYIDISSIDRESKRIAMVNRLSGKEAPSRAKQLVKANDVLVSTVRPNLNAVSVVLGELDGATASTGFTVLRVDPTKLDCRYLFHWVKTPQFVMEMVKLATGASYPAVSDAIVKASKIPLPSLLEQRRIAAILDKADAIRELRRRAIAKLDTLLRAVFLEMFGDPVTNPKGWIMRELGNAGLIISDGNYAEKYPRTNDFTDDGIPFIRANNIRRLTVVADDMRFITPEKHQELKKGHLRKADVLISTRGEIGNVALVPSEFNGANINAQLVLLRSANGEINPIYLLWALAHPKMKRVFKSYQTGTALKQLPVGRLLKVKIPLPPIELQRKFADLASCARHIQNLQNLGAVQSDILFHSLQQRAFTGKLFTEKAAAAAQQELFAD